MEAAAENNADYGGSSEGCGKDFEKGDMVGALGFGGGLFWLLLVFWAAVSRAAWG